MLPLADAYKEHTAVEAGYSSVPNRSADPNKCAGGKILEKE